MIVLFTDFGWQGPYVGQMKAVLKSSAPDVPVIDLMHDVPAFDAVAAAYLLAALVPQFPLDSIFVAVVDPGVGEPARRPYMVQVDGRWFVGPDNGLFNVIEARGSDVQRYEILWRPATLSTSFHGRDLFAPVAAMLSQWNMPDNNLLAQRELSINNDLYQVIYIDHFGNAMTGIQATSISTDKIISINGQALHFAETFSYAPEGQPFWYFNSCNLVELAVNKGNASKTLSLEIGDTVDIID
jgi:S-adenosylmethionine hydrolase